MNKKIALFLALNLITLTPIVHADFLDLSGAILWHSAGDNGEGFIQEFKRTLESGWVDCYTRFDINHGLDQNNGAYNDYQGWTLLMMAAHKGISPVVEALLRANADLWIKNNEGQAAIDIAKAAGHEHIVPLIMSYVTPASLVKQSIRVVVSNIKNSEDSAAEFASLMPRLPDDLNEKIEAELKKHN